MLQGYKTYIGLIITLLGVIGFYEKTGISSEQAGQILDSLFQIVGLLISAYGNYDVHKRLNSK